MLKAYNILIYAFQGTKISENLEIFLFCSLYAHQLFLASSPTIVRLVHTPDLAKWEAKQTFLGHLEFSQ